MPVTIMEEAHPRRRGPVRSDGFISHRTRLEEINETIAKMRTGEIIHALIHFD
ncbi:MAG TPA: hypothetical protein VK581_00440 [Chthoniobacterales bacterium]|nr:hypothetical protein [Chthoniobacterales bacterium]